MVLEGVEETEIGVGLENTVGSAKEVGHLFDVVFDFVCVFDVIGEAAKIFHQGHVDTIGDVGDDEVNGFWGHVVKHEVPTINVEEGGGEIDVVGGEGGGRGLGRGWGGGGGWGVRAEREGDNAGCAGCARCRSDGKGRSGKGGLGCDSGVLFAGEEDLLSGLHGRRVENFLVTTIEVFGYDKAVSYVGMRDTHEGAGGSSSPLVTGFGCFVPLGGVFGFAFVNHVDSDSNFLPLHFFTAEIGFDFKHTEIVGGDLVTADNWDFEFTEQFIGGIATAAVDEVVVFVD